MLIFDEFLKMIVEIVVRLFLNSRNEQRGLHYLAKLARSV